MAIWKSEISLEAVSQRSKDTLITHLEIEFIEIGGDFLVAKMPIKPFVMQPLGSLHGGASCVLAETVGSSAANFCVDFSKFYCLGLEINVNHLRPVMAGWLFATAKPFHLGKKTHVWGIEIRNDNDDLVAISRHTVMVLPRI